MKILLAVLVVAISISAQAQGFIHLTTGQSYTYSFSSLPRLGLGPDAYRAFAVWTFTNGFSYPTVTEVSIERFETSEMDAPIASRSLPLFNNSNEKSHGLIGVFGGWQDLQGAMRVSVVSGAVDLSRVEVQVYGGDFALYGQVVNVPEPSSMLLFGLGVTAFCLFRSGLPGLIMRCSERRRAVAVAIGASRGRRR